MDSFLKKLRTKFNNIGSRAELKNLSINFANFGLFQIISYIVPLVTIPYIVRVIGPEKFGIISIAQAVTYYLWIIADYGYSISGVRLISQNQDSRQECSVIVKNVFVIQLVLNFFCILVLLLILEFYKPFSAYKSIFLFYIFSIPANILLAPWFYTGMEKVKYVSTLTLFSRLIYVILIFALLKTEQDYLLIPVYYSFSLLAGGVFSFIVLLRKFGIKIGRPVALTLMTFIKREREIFVSSILINLYRNSNVLILSLFTGEGIVGIYSAGEKIIKAVQGTFAPITQTFYPYISRLTVTSRTHSKVVIKYLFSGIGILAGAVSVMFFAGSDVINQLAFGKKFMDTAIILKIGAPAILLGSLNFIIGIIFMTNYDMKKEFLKSVTIVGALNFVICSLLSHYYTAVGAAVAFSTAEIILFGVMSLYIFKRQLKLKSAYETE